ncbi:unnamed protein product [Cladocopium goreaui]|uniref:Retrovirus-related Pol polyprotein from transposon TNT 1-94 n=1 Tax=Cladocopium goreaui TaxID=2562237 RepID=A0A9P1GTZ5_9DINO|nr:unnamed protein product [Cladocopium goreaui]
MSPQCMHVYSAALFEVAQNGESAFRMVAELEKKTGSCVWSSTWTSPTRGQIPGKTGKGKAKGQGKAQERTRSARAIERRILRGAARRAEGLLNTTVEAASGTTNRPDHNELDYVEGLRLQAVPEQEVPEFLDVNRTVVGGLPTHSKAGGATKRVWGKFEKDYPSLAKVVQSTPGGKARKSFAQEEGGRRVAQGLVEEVGEEEETHAATSVWYSVDEFGNFKEEVDDSPEEEERPKTEQASSAASSSSVGVSEVARAVQDLELRSQKASEERNQEGREEGRDYQREELEDREERDYQREELEDRESNWSETASSSSTSWSRSTWSSNWGSDQSREQTDKLTRTETELAQRTQDPLDDAMQTPEEDLLAKAMYTEFERTSKSVFSEEEKVSILAHVAPPELQQSIFMHSDALGTYAKIRDYIEQYLINKNVWKRPQGSQFGITKAANKVDDGGLMDMTVTDSAESLLSVFNMVEKGVRFEEEKEPDTWRMETNEEGEFVVRVHNTARFQLFSPERMADLPVPINRLLPGRLTKIYFSEDGSHVEDQSLWTRKQTSAKNMGREWLGESWFRLKPETEIPEKKDAEIEEAKKVEGVRDPDQDMDEFFLDWVYVEDRVQPDPIDQDQAEREVFREQRQLDEEEEVKEQAQEVDVPKAPSAQQREEHRLHHANFEPWCETCIKGQGRDAHHRRSKEDKKEHIIYSDYMFFSVDGEMVNRSEGKKQKGLITVLTAICKDSQYPFAMVVPSKGGEYYSRDALAAWIRDLGWNKVTIQIDQENSMNKLFDRVRDLMPERVEIRKSPRYSSQSLADGEMVNGLIAGKIRTWLCELSESYATKIGTEHYVFPWIVRHSAWTLARFHVNKSKTTAFRVIKGRDYVGELIPFGETVMGKFPKVKDKSAPRWTKGIYAGKKENSDEHMMLTSAGAISFRTVRRLPVGSQFQDAVMEVARGVPWNTVLGIEKAKPEAISSEVKAIVAPEIEGGKAQKSTKKEDKAPEMQVDDEGERIEIEEKDSKKPRLAEGTTSSAVPGDTGMNPGQPELYRIDTPTDDNMSAAGTASQDMVSGVSNGEVPDAEEMRKKYHMPVNKDHVWFQKWLDERKEYFQSEMVANIMDYLDQIGAAEEEQKKARKTEIKKLNEDFGAFTPRDGDKTGQPVMMKPPKEWLEDYDDWYLLQPKEVQEELKDDRPDIKFSTKELAKRIREPRECDMANLKVLGRYLRGTTNYGHVTKLTEGIDIREGIPMHCYCDSELVRNGCELIGLVDLTEEHFDDRLWNNAASQEELHSALAPRRSSTLRPISSTADLAHQMQVLDIDDDAEFLTQPVSESRAQEIMKAVAESLPYLSDHMDASELQRDISQALRDASLVTLMAC